MKNPLTIFSKKVQIDKVRAQALEELKKRHGIMPISSDKQCYFLLDCSGSMLDDNKINQAKQGAIGLAKEIIEGGNKIGLIVFGDTTRICCEITENYEIFKAEVEKLQPDGGTPMAEAIKIARKRIKNGDVIILVTDGMPDNENSAILEAEQAKKMGIGIVAIGTDLANRDFLKRISSGEDMWSKITANNLGDEIISLGKKSLLLTEK